MALSAFDDKSRPPADPELSAALGGSSSAWHELKRTIAARFAAISEEWGFTSKSTGWGLRLKHKERIILYMTPRQGHFLVSFALGEKAVQAAQQSDLSRTVLDVIDGAKKYAEGRGVRFEIRSSDEIEALVKLAAIKIAS